MELQWLKACPYWLCNFRIGVHCNEILTISMRWLVSWGRESSLKVHWHFRHKAMSNGLVINKLSLFNSVTSECSTLGTIPSLFLFIIIPCWQRLSSTLTVWALIRYLHFWPLVQTQASADWNLAAAANSVPNIPEAALRLGRTKVCTLQSFSAQT